MISMKQYNYNQGIEDHLSRVARHEYSEAKRGQEDGGHTPMITVINDNSEK